MLPKVFGGLSTSFRYKGFDLAATFDYQIGGKVYDVQYATLMAPARVEMMQVTLYIRITLSLGVLTTHQATFLVGSMATCIAQLHQIVS